MTIRIKSLEENLPIEGATLKLLNTRNNYEYRTDDNGEVELNFEGQYLVHRDSYVKRIITVKKEVVQEFKLIGNEPTIYTNKIEYFPGEKIEIYGHYPTSVILKLYRHGKNLEYICDVGKPKIFNQEPIDNIDIVESGFEWDLTDTTDLPVDLQPGLYSIRVLSEDEKNLFQASPIIVNTLPEKRGKCSKILVLASNTTWQSYNVHGGRSRYRLNERQTSASSRGSSKNIRLKLIQVIGKILPVFIKRFILDRKIFKEPALEWKFKRLTVSRPFKHVGLTSDTPVEPFLNHLAGGEWRLLAWLEREKIKYDYTSCNQLHFDSHLLSNYKAIVFNTHCEYWSKEMYDAVLSHNKNRGLWLINASGNTMYRAINFYNNGDTRCVSLSFRDYYRDETELTGSRFDTLDYGTAAPYKVMKANHWAFRNTSMTAGSVFGKKSLNTNVPNLDKGYNPGRLGHPDGLKGQGASGWECDKRPLKRTKNYLLLAKGLNPEGGAEMIIKEPTHNSGGVFSAGSITFTGALLVDNNLSIIMKNVFTRIIEE